jgi:hypothetical protein
VNFFVQRSKKHREWQKTSKVFEISAEIYKGMLYFFKEEHMAIDAVGGTRAPHNAPPPPPKKQPPQAQAPRKQTPPPPAQNHVNRTA